MSIYTKIFAPLAEAYNQSKFQPYLREKLRLFLRKISQDIHTFP